MGNLWWHMATYTRWVRMGGSRLFSYVWLLIYLHWLIESNSLWMVKALQESGHLMQVLRIHLNKVPLYWRHCIGMWSSVVTTHRKPQTGVLYGSRSVTHLEQFINLPSNTTGCPRSWCYFIRIYCLIIFHSTGRCTNTCAPLSFRFWLGSWYRAPWFLFTYFSTGLEENLWKIFHEINERLIRTVLDQ